MIYRGYLFLFNACQRYFSSLMLSRQDDTSTSHLYKKTRFKNYNDPMNPSMKGGSQSLLFIAYLFSESLSKISLTFLSKKIFT